jgi:hypothetical protein
MNEVIIYAFTFLFLILIFLAGTKTFVFLTGQRKAQIALPAGILTGIGISIFAVNTLSYVFRGPTNAFALIIFLASLALLLRKEKLILPKNKTLWIASASLWLVFSFFIAKSARIDGADSTIHYSIASVFARGDFPPHSPWQPEFVAHYHTGWAQFFGIARIITSGSYTFIQAVFSWAILWAMSQILIFGIRRKIGKSNFLSLNIPPLVALIALGAFFVAIPTSTVHNEVGERFTSWLLMQPTLVNAIEVYGSPADLDALIFFVHRFISIALLLVISSVLLAKQKVKNSKLLVFMFLMLSAVALVDESVFIVSLPAIVLFMFIRIFRKNVVSTLIFTTIVLIVSAIQGGVITETILNRYNEASHVLIFPNDSEKRGQNYRSYRIKQQETSFFTSEQNSPLSWVHIGILWQLGILLGICLIHKKSKQSMFYFLLLGVLSYIAYFALVPKGMYHANGNRFLTMAYLFSAIGLAIYLRSALASKRKIIHLLIIWLLTASIAPPLAKTLLSRPSINWFTTSIADKPNDWQKWVKKNTNINDNILVLNDTIPVNSGNIELVRKVGAHTPVWGDDIRVYDSFDTSPIFSDVFYTLNPNLLEELSVKYLVTNDTYLASIHPERIVDIKNPDYFSTAYQMPTSLDSKNTKILEIKNGYLKNAKSLNGTFNQLSSIAPKNGTYYIDYPPNITEGVFRILLLTLRNHEIYYNTQGAFYNSRLSVDAPYYGSQDKEKYDYYVLGKAVDPLSLCSCTNIELIWEGYGNNVNLWKAH